MRIPRLKRRLATHRDIIGKTRTLQVMRELEPGLTHKEASRAYDMVTRALNGILRAYARDLPKDTHLALRVADCFSVNLCWIKGYEQMYSDFPTIWISAGDRIRNQISRLRCQEYRAWRATRVQGGDRAHIDERTRE